MFFILVVEIFEQICIGQIIQRIYPKTSKISTPNSMPCHSCILMTRHVKKKKCLIRMDVMWKKSWTLTSMVEFEFQIQRLDIPWARCGLPASQFPHTHITYDNAGLLWELNMMMSSRSSPMAICNTRCSINVS